MTVCLVTDRRRLSSSNDDEATACLYQQARYAIDAGIDLLQVREPGLPVRTLVHLVRDIVALARKSRTRVIVNDRLDVALASGASGVHLRADSIDWQSARRVAPVPFMIGCSVHSGEEAAAADGADYVIAGTVWASESKPADHPLLGLHGLAAIAKATRAPVLAIGGLTHDRLGEVAAAGAAGIAAIGLFMSPDPASCRAVPLRSMVETVRLAFDTSRSGS